MVDQAELERKVGKAKALLILDHPFFGSTVAKRALVFTDSPQIPTAACSKRGTIYLNVEFIGDLTISELVFLLAHEALHYMLMHALRIGHRKPKQWNKAADKVINDTLIDAKVGTFIEGGLTFDGARDQCAEELYDEDEDDGDGEGTGGGGSGGIGTDLGNAPDDGDPLDESEVHELEAQTKIETLQAAKAAKAMGKLPANIERMIDEMINVKTPWHDILERFMSGKIKDGHSWKRPNRRFIARGLYIPGCDYVPRMGPIVIGVDTSGSIGQQELNEFNGHINRILETCNPEKVTVVYCDSAVNHVDYYEPDDFPVKLSPHGGGGTSFKPVIDWIDNCPDEVECLVYLTDGYGDQNNIPEPVFPTVWLTTGSESFNWGTVIKFEAEV
jgi:predicted metal-dependent peptidase